MSLRGPCHFHYMPWDRCLEKREHDNCHCRGSFHRTCCISARSCSTLLKPQGLGYIGRNSAFDTPSKTSTSTRTGQQGDVDWEGHFLRRTLHSQLRTSGARPSRTASTEIPRANGPVSIPVPERFYSIVSVVAVVLKAASAAFSRPSSRQGYRRSATRYYRCPRAYQELRTTSLRIQRLVFVESYCLVLPEALEDNTKVKCERGDSYRRR